MGHDRLPADLRLLEARYWLGVDDGYESHREGHLPGAFFVDLERELSRSG